VTHNQGKYIRRLQNIVAQDTDIDYEVIAGDACSTDEITEIVLEFSLRHFNIIMNNPFIGLNQGKLESLKVTHLLDLLMRHF
jgi:glycosyltransferase involved in cell wall biosynthesis